jgi:hypothetical protein
MDEGAAAGWGNHDITSDGRIVEECVCTPDRGRRITWYDERGRVARRESIAQERSRASHGLTA